jgi:hypothetical protein
MYKLESLELRIRETGVIFGIVKCPTERQGRDACATIECSEGELMDW